MTNVLDTERVALMQARADALNLAIDIEEVALSLRTVAAGKAAPGEATFVRGFLDAHGDLVIRGQLNWRLLLDHARAPRRSVAHDGGLDGDAGFSR